MLYYGELLGRNKKTYRVELLTDGDDSVKKQLTLVANGVLVRIDGAEDMFAPMRGGSASITIKTDELLMDLYTTNPMGVSVTIYEDKALLFFGYVTPSMYSTAFVSGRKSDLTIECRDALSVLADIDFDSDSDSDSFQDIIEKALHKVSTGEITLDIVQPFDASLMNLSVIRANWFDEGGEASKWSEVLNSILQWCGMRITQWRDKWYIRDFRHVYDAVDLDELSANMSPTISLTEVHQKNKIEVSLYEDGDKIIDAFDGWELQHTERYYQSAIKGAPENWDAYLAHYSASNIKLHQYRPNSYTQAENIEYTGDALSKKVGGWLIGSSSGEFKQLSGSDKIKALEDHNSAEKYIVIAVPQQKVSWRTEYVSDYYEARKYPAITLKDTVSRVYGTNHILVVSGKVLMTTNPSPVLCRALDGKRFDGVTGKSYDYETQGATAIGIRVRIGNKTLGVIDGVMGWDLDKNNSTYNDIIGVPLFSKQEKNPFNKDLSIIDNSYEFYINVEGHGISIPSEIEGVLEVDIMVDAGESISEYAYISDFKVGLGHTTEGGLEKLKYDLDEKKDVVYENETDDVYTTPYEMRLQVSSRSSDYNYSRSVVYNNVSGVRKPVGELTSTATGESAIAEHHLLNAITLQNEEPRMVIDGTWRNHIANPTHSYFSDNLEREFLVESLEIDCDASTSRMKLEQIL